MIGIRFSSANINLEEWHGDFEPEYLSQRIGDVTPFSEQF